MKNLFKNVLTLVVLVSAPALLKAAPQSGEPLTAKTLRTAEASAKTKADHLRLAAYYRSRAEQAQSKLTDAEAQMKNWTWLENSSKVPNAYTSSKSLVEKYRSEVDTNTRLAADHEKMAQNLSS